MSKEFISVFPLNKYEIKALSTLVDGEHGKNKDILEELTHNNNLLKLLLPQIMKAILNYHLMS